MIIDVVTLFPEMFPSLLDTSILGRAREKGLYEAHFTDPRAFVDPKVTDPAVWQRRQIDDTPYGGGAGMVIRPEPVVAALESIEAARGPAHKIYLTPSGRPLDQGKVRELAARPHLVLLCGRYEGIDDRALAFVDEQLSIGDYVLSGGELAAAVVIDAVVRLQVGALGNAASAADESFSDVLLEYPHYTRPAAFRGVPVPEVLTSGNHAKIARWRRQQALIRTRDRRPDLWQKLGALSPEDQKLLAEVGEPDKST